MKPILCFILLCSSMCTWAQQAKDYLCLDSTVTLYYKDRSGDTLTLKFQQSFDHEGYTICYYTQKWLHYNNENTVFFAYKDDVLIEGSYVVFKKFNGINYLDTQIKIVKPNEVGDTSYSVSFDMQTTEFKQTTRMLKKYTGSNGKKYKNVIEVDQHNLTDDFHYVTLYAPGIGIIAQGRDEKVFLKAVKG